MKWQKVFQTDPVVWIENPNPRVDDSRWVIGPARSGRVLTIVVDRDPADHGVWHVMTAWGSTETQVRLCRNARCPVRLRLVMTSPHDHDPAAFDKELANAERAAREGRDAEAVFADALRSAA